jgi:hypothetical protein
MANTKRLIQKCRDGIRILEEVIRELELESESKTKPEPVESIKAEYDIRAVFNECFRVPENHEIGTAKHLTVIDIRRTLEQRSGRQISSFAITSTLKVIGIKGETVGPLYAKRKGYYLIVTS